jgi:hypothetical protein
MNQTTFGNIDDLINAVKSHYYNHDIAGNRSGIATARRLTEEEKEITRRMVRTGSSATATLDYLTETTGNLWSTRREISL